MKSKSLLIGCAAAIAAGGSGGPSAFAPSGYSYAGIIEEIIVTARRREDALQQVPLSVSAITGDELRRRGFQDLQDISQETSGLVYENFVTAGLSTAAVIRGMGQTFTTARIQNTAVFLDGIYLQRQSMVNPGLMNLERVEVIKGPQNAQFGRSAFSGVVNYVSRRPGEELAGDVSATYGDGGRFDARGSVSVPLVPSALHLRLAAGHSQFDGHTKNHHPFADDGPSGRRSTDDRVGGWDDQYYSATLAWSPTDDLQTELSYYQTDAIREPQPFYSLNGARYLYDNFEVGPPPSFPYLAPLGANCNNTVTFDNNVPAPAAGPHSYCGKLPSAPPDLPDAALEAAGFGDTSGRVAVDPRSLALDAQSKITRFSLHYDLTEALSLDYQFGYVEHEAVNFGAAEGRISLLGSTVPYLPVEQTPFPPFIRALGPPGSFGATAQSTLINANPLEDLEATSHEIRLTRTTEGLTMRAGLYLSDNDHSDVNVFYFLPPCNGPAACGTPAPESVNPFEGTYVAVVEAVPGVLNIGIPSPFDTGNRALGNQVLYEDKVTAVFGDLEWRISDQFTLALEGRYTWEEQHFEQLTRLFGAPMPDNVNSVYDEQFTLFTPRAILEWSLTDRNMAYALVAKGAKWGGYNPVDPTVNPEQAVYDEETNITYELGTKNRLLDNRLTLNAAAFFIDWKDVQGTEAASSPEAWATNVIGNIGDAEVLGFEIDGSLIASESVWLDFHMAYSDAEYKDAVYQSAVAGRSSSWGCNGTVCPADGRVDGNQVERTSKWQYGAGLNFGRSLGGEWRLGARFDFNHRSKMYASPLNLAHNGGRTLANANVNLSSDHWNVTVWGRNVFDKEYVANSIVLAQFTRYVVGLGARRTLGLTVSYSL